MMNYIFIIIFTFSCFLLNAQSIYLCFGVNKATTSVIYRGNNIDNKNSCPDINFIVESNNNRLVSVKTGFFLCRSLDVNYTDNSLQPIYVVDYKANFIEVPLLLTLNLPRNSNYLKFFLSAGPSWSHGIGGEKYTQFGNTTIVDGYPKEINSQNLGILLSSGINFRKLQLSIYYRSFNNMQKTNSINDIKKLNNSLLGFNIAFIINFSQNRTSYY